MSYNDTLKRLEAAMAPHLLSAPPAVIHMGKDKNGRPAPYWQSGPVGYGVTALTEDVCNRVALESVRSLANIPPSLARIPWC